MTKGDGNIAYYLPLRFIHVSDDMCICATRIVAIGSTKLYPIREMLKAERENGTLLNACGKERSQTAIILDNGSIISSPRSIKSLMRAIEMSNSKKVSKDEVLRESKRMRVYDVKDEVPNEELDEDMPSASCMPFEDEEFPFDEIMDDEGDGNDE